MVFRRQDCVISAQTVNDVADDIIEIAELASNKSALRNSLIFERLKCSNQHSMLTAYDINNMTQSLSKHYVKPDAVYTMIRKISKELQKQYKLLSDINKELR